MATLGSNNLTWLDHAKLLDSTGKIAKVSEVLNKKNDILDSYCMIESNQSLSHKGVIRQSLPQPAWRQFNKGTAPLKGQVRQVEFGAGIIETLSQVDEELVNLSSDPGGFRLAQSAPHIEAISQLLAQTIVYGDTKVNADRFAGWASVWNSPSDALVGSNVLSAGGSGSDNTSMYLICSSPETVCGFYPKGTKAGIEHNDLGKIMVDDGAGGKYLAWVDQFRVRFGQACLDWRFGARICNIDVSDLATSGQSSGDVAPLLFRMMIKAINQLPDLNSGRLSFYCNKEVKTALDIQAFNKGNIHLNIVQDVQKGAPITTFMGIPIRRVDAILNTEATIS